MKSLKISSIILPILTSLLLIIFLGSLDTNFTLYKQLSCAVLFIYNIFIFLSFLAFGVAGSVIYVSIFSAIALFVATLTHSYFLNFHILIYITLDAFLYYQKRVTENIKGSRLAKIESIEKDINLLKEEYNKRQSQAKAYQKKFSKFAILKDVVEKLSTSLSVPEVANLIVSKSFNIIGKADICKLFLVDEKKHKLVLTSVRKSEEYKNLKIKEPDHFDKRVFNKKEPLAIQDIRKDYRFDYEAIKDKIVDFRSTIATPLISKGRSIGVLRLDSSRPGNLSTEDLRLLNILADLTAVSVDNARLYEKTEELARTDSLTGCLVKKYMRELTKEELSKAEQKEEKVSFLMIDIDHFKKYNDEYGHIAGDIVLKEAAELFKKYSPDNAIVSRYGGEEFAIILSDTEKEKAKDIAENIRQKMEEKIFYLRRKKTKVALSIGVATFTDDADNLDDLIRKADKALYKAKEKGRNQVCLS